PIDSCVSTGTRSAVALSRSIAQTLSVRESLLRRQSATWDLCRCSPRDRSVHIPTLGRIGPTTNAGPALRHALRQTPDFQAVVAETAAVAGDWNGTCSPIRTCAEDVSNECIWCDESRRCRDR